jgi:hypothetical protein
MSRISILIQDFKYPPETIKDDNLELTAETAVASYEAVIAELCRKTPPFWKPDAIQELRLCVLQAFRRSRYLDSETMIQDLNTRLKSMEKLERNRGMREAPEILDPLELQEHIKAGYYHEPDRGRKLKIHNHL